MKFTGKTLSCLEYDKILSMLCELCATDGAKARARSLMPSSSLEDIIEAQRRTEDAKRLISIKGYPSFSAPEGVVEASERAYKGGVLSARELLSVASLFGSVDRLLDYINTDKPFTTSLDELFSRLMPNKGLYERITRAIIGEDMIADEASPELADIRRRIRNTNNRIKDTLSGYASGARLKYLQENIVTQRNGRYVVPVKSEYKNEVKGLVHDTSSSGATVFIEPMAVVELNNELKGLEGRERGEIDRILKLLSASVGEYTATVSVNYHAITELAFIFARGSLAHAMRATMPNITRDGGVKLIRARHPLLEGDKVVPIDVTVGDEYSVMVITGPNTGGKTVTLKTVGLFALMAQSGLQLPCDEGSSISVYDGVLVDIGDEQSIEASLSTFSSHMVTVIDILKRACERSLVLLDELGSGTDPIEGAALATAIIDRLLSSRATVLATTHYAELKAYALKTEGVRNASCEFDVETLRPTYKLIIGSPGKSNAFAISERLGMPSAIIERASELVSTDSKRFEDVIARLESERMMMERAREEAERMRREYEEYRKNSERELHERLKKSEDEIERNLAKSRRILDSAEASSEYIFRQLDDIRKQEDRKLRDDMVSRAKDEVRKRLRDENALLSEADLREMEEDEDYVLPRPLKVGDTVLVTTLSQTGVLQTLADKKGLYLVKCGIAALRVSEDKLRLIEGKIKTSSAPSRAGDKSLKRSAAATFRVELDVRGMFGDDAWFLVDKYLDDAVLANVPSVRIIHGKGTGALRAALWKMFKTDPRIKSYRHGEWGEGDSGVTVIEFK
ncbi:MAG: endonuclease MutS2 [Clostridia bacterium]|nr:endonuclease MutS2 [Clostridia bacterium]